jgi:hypothetical protein
VKILARVDRRPSGRIEAENGYPQPPDRRAIERIVFLNVHSRRSVRIDAADFNATKHQRMVLVCGHIPDIASIVDFHPRDAQRTYFETAGVDGSFRTREGPTIQRAAYLTPPTMVPVRTIDEHHHQEDHPSEQRSGTMFCDKPPKLRGGFI